MTLGDYHTTTAQEVHQASHELMRHAPTLVHLQSIRRGDILAHPRDGWLARMRGLTWLSVNTVAVGVGC